MTIKLPLFWKFVIAIVTIVAFFGSINAYLIWTNVQKVLEKESEKRAIFIAKNLSNQLITPLLFEDLVSAQKLLDDATLLDTTLVYAFLIDKENLILHTFQNEVPINLLNLPIKFESNYQVTLVKDAQAYGPIIRDIAIPIFEGRLGVLRIGISEESIFYDVKDTVISFWIMVGFFLLFGLIGALIFAHIITKPLSQIREASDELSLEAFVDGHLPTVKIRNMHTRNNIFVFRTHDEIDELTENFNKMLLRLKKTYEALKQTQKSLVESEKLATIGTVASGVAHEINNPISGIQNAIRRILKAPRNVTQNLNYLKMMLSASERIENVVKELLNYSRKEELILEQFDILDILVKVELLLSHKIEKIRVEFLVFIDDENKIVYGSPNHIQQVIINLVLNSVDAIQKKEENKGRIIIKVVNEANWSLITVEDNGCGFNVSLRDKIFEPFYTSKEIQKGTGLGLSVTKQIIDAHRGEITVESEVDKGTKFIIKLLKK